jgi:hypothetical protein
MGSYRDVCWIMSGSEYYGKTMMAKEAYTMEVRHSMKGRLNFWVLMKMIFQLIESWFT